jgi:hypothetical protein
MLRLSCLLLAISLTLSSRVLTKVSSALTIYTNGPSLINDAYQVLYDKPKETIYFFTVPSTIYPDSIYMSPDISEVRSYGVSYNNVINPLTRKTQQLSGSFQSTSKASQVKPPYIAYTAGVGYPITTNTNVNYQASGLSWATYYTLYLSADETRANVEGYINVNNRSGKNFT